MLLALMVPSLVVGQREPGLWIKGQFVHSDVAPYIEGERTLVPIRVISESLGYHVDWEPTKREVLIEKEAMSAKMTIGNKRIHVKTGEKTKDLAIDVPAQIKSDRTFVPLRSVAELFGETVDWDPEMFAVLIGDRKAYDQLTPEEKEENLPKPENKPTPLPPTTPGQTGDVAVYLKELKDETQDRGEVRFDPAKKEFSLQPRGLAAKMYRHLRDHQNVEGIAKEAFEAEIAYIKDYSIKLRRETEQTYRIRVTDPDHRDKTLLSIENGQVIENHLNKG